MASTIDSDGVPAKKSRLSVDESVKKEPAQADNVKDSVDQLRDLMEGMKEELAATILRLEGREKGKKKEHKKKFILKETFRNVLGMRKNGKEISSKPEEHFGFNWHMGISRKYNDQLRVFLYCKGLDGHGDFRVVANMKIWLWLQQDQGFFKSHSNPFDKKNTGWGVEYYPWSKLTEELKENEVTVEFHMKIAKIEFGPIKQHQYAEPVNGMTDAILKLGEERLYVSKHALAIQSPVLKSTLIDYAKQGQTVFELNGDDPTDFKNFLDIVYGEKEFNENTVEGILVIADKYIANKVMRHCEEDLIYKSTKTREKKLSIAIQFKLDKLLIDCISKLKDKNEYRSMVKSLGRLADLKKPVSDALIEKSMELMI